MVQKDTIKSMAYQYTNNITIPKALIRKKEGVVILPLEEYEKIKEDLEMMRSKRLAKEIKIARKEVAKGEIINLEEVERKLNL